ncbi:O-antigen ligase [Mycobacterium sp. BK558]|nr:O-antigen ligase [Mycobacterium sp. BK558]
MNSPAIASRIPAAGSWAPATAVAFGTLATVAVALLSGSKFGQLALFGAMALAVGLCALHSPRFAVILLIVTTFLRLPLSTQMVLPVELWLIVFAVVMVATAAWMIRTPSRVRGIGAVECAMALYLCWNLYSMITPHKYPAIDPDNGGPMPVLRFIVIATLIPFAAYVVGRFAFDRPAAVRALFWTLLGVSAYSAAVSIMPFVGLGDWVWPRYIVTDPAWIGRAVGVPNQPVVNGMVLVLGFAIGTTLATRRGEPGWRRCIALLVVASCGVSIYLTYTRAVWMSALLMLVLGACLARGYRGGFVAALGLVASVVALNWSRFTSSDRTAGGVASESEIESRLNDIQTALWARTQEPLTGWGIGRFPAVNRYHHQQWSPDVPWISGYGEVSHTNELGLLAELGIIGLALWICVLVLVAYRLKDAYRALPDHDLCGKPLALIAIMAIAILLCTGTTVDLRFFDFPTIATFLLVGVAIGWADRTRRTNTAAGENVIVERELQRHG